MCLCKMSMLHYAFAKWVWLYNPHLSFIHTFILSCDISAFNHPSVHSWHNSFNSSFQNQGQRQHVQSGEADKNCGAQPTQQWSLHHSREREQGLGYSRGDVPPPMRSVEAKKPMLREALFIFLYWQLQYSDGQCIVLAGGSRPSPPYLCHW